MLKPNKTWTVRFQGIRDNFSGNDGENPVDCAENLKENLKKLREELWDRYVSPSYAATGTFVRIRQSTLSGILAWAVNQADEDPRELTIYGTTYFRCFDLALAIGRGLAADKMPEWMPAAAVMVRAHQF